MLSAADGAAYEYRLLREYPDLSLAPHRRADSRLICNSRVRAACWNSDRIDAMLTCFLAALPGYWAPALVFGFFMNSIARILVAVCVRRDLAFHRHAPAAPGGCTRPPAARAHLPY